MENKPGGRIRQGILSERSSATTANRSTTVWSRRPLRYKSLSRHDNSSQSSKKEVNPFGEILRAKIKDILIKEIPLARS